MTSSAPLAGQGWLTFVYACEPQDDILELQAWRRATAHHSP